MSWEIYTKIVDEISDNNQLLMLNLHKDGEPFLHPRFIDMVRYAKKKNAAKIIHVNTNALCLTNKVIDGLLDSGIDDITISLDAAWKETYRKHKGIDCLENVEAKIRRFYERRKQLGLSHPFARVKIMEFEDISEEEIKDFFNKWREIADMVQVTGIHSWSGEIKGLKISDETSPVRYPCVIMWYALVINWNGEVTVCSVDWNTEIKVGDVNNQTLYEIWNSPEIKSARRSQIEKQYNKYKVCENCVVWVPIGDLRDWLKEKREFYL